MYTVQFRHLFWLHASIYDGDVSKLNGSRRSLPAFLLGLGRVRLQRITGCGVKLQVLLPEGSENAEIVKCDFVSVTHGALLVPEAFEGWCVARIVWV
jgi:hypothetical protein